MLILASEFFDSFDKTKNYLGDIRGKNVLLIETAAIGEGWSPDPETNIKPFENLGAKVTVFDLKDKTQDEVDSVLDTSDIVYVCGGNTFYLLYHMKACNFVSLLSKHLKKGLIYIGSSAGSIVLCPDINFISPMDDPSVVSLDDTQGLSLVDFLFLPHLDHEHLSNAAKVISENYDDETLLFALKDNQAIIVQGKKAFLI